MNMKKTTKTLIALLMTSSAFAVNLQNFRFTNNQYYTTTMDALHPSRSIYQKTSFLKSVNGKEIKESLPIQQMVGS